jgi:surfeit locus 1 family protein
VLSFGVVAAFASLGRWQWDRGQARELQRQEFERGAEQALPLGSRGLPEIPRFRKVAVTGIYDVRHQFLLDNRVRSGRAGYEVLTPLVLADGRTLLVDRGWLPSSGYRDRLPDVGFSPAQPESLIARVDELPSRGLARGTAAPDPAGQWPKVTSFPTTAELGAALGRAVEPRLLLLDPDASHGYLRDWQPPGLTPARHWAYAVQWWALAAAVVFLWGLMSLKREPIRQ